MEHRQTIEINNRTSKVVPVELQRVQIDAEWEECICATIDDFNKSRLKGIRYKAGICDTHTHTHTQINRYAKSSGHFRNCRNSSVVLF
jgi:hypothetical protein